MDLATLALLTDALLARRRDEDDSTTVAKIVKLLIVLAIFVGPAIVRWVKEQQDKARQPPPPRPEPSVESWQPREPHRHTDAEADDGEVMDEVDEPQREVAYERYDRDAPSAAPSAWAEPDPPVAPPAWRPPQAAARFATVSPVSPPALPLFAPAAEPAALPAGGGLHLPAGLTEAQRLVVLSELLPRRSGAQGARRRPPARQARRQK